MFLSIVVALKPYSQRAALSQNRPAHAAETIMIDLCACDLMWPCLAGKKAVLSGYCPAHTEEGNCLREDGEKH